MFEKMMAATVALLLGATALAHGGAEHARGTVKSVAADAITVSTDHGTRTFRVTPRTSVVKDGAVSAVGELHAGDRVVVHAAHSSPLEAERVDARSEVRRQRDP